MSKKTCLFSCDRKLGWCGLLEKTGDQFFGKVKGAESMEQKNEEFAIIDNYLCIRMPKEVDHHGAAGIRECADKLILNDEVKNIVFDFEDTSFMDSSGLGIIIGRYRKISCFGGKVYAINTSERINRLLRSSGMSSIIEILA